MGLRDIGASLPPGFRFYPSDEELVCHYLFKKITNEDVLKGTLVEIDLHTCEPWQLPEVAKLNANEWYFFSFRDRKYATGFRTNRATTSGYWKATGKDRTVLDPTTREIVGMRKTLVFYRNRAPNGIKTGWIMHEFRLETPRMPPKEDWVLCRVFHKGKGSIDNQNNSNKLYEPDFMFETIITPSSTTSLTDHQSLPCGYQHQITSLSSNQSSLLNLLHQEKNTNIPIITCSTITSTDVSSKGVNGEDFGFIWDDMNFEAADSSLEDMSFDQMGNNSMVFL